MFNITKIKTDIKPAKIESLGNEMWYYNYDITESVEPGQNGENCTMYEFLQVRVAGKPTYDNCVKAVIRAYVSESDEFDLINQYNAYQVGLNVDKIDYQKYLELTSEIKQKVAKDFPKTKDIISQPSSPRLSDIAKLLQMTINTMSITDDEALSVKTLYPNWEDMIGKTLEVGTKVQYNGKLFKVIQQHTAQSDWAPGINTASLYTEIVENHSGTLEDPIPYPEDGNMVIYNGKYYIENGIIYICIRDSQIPLYTALANVVDNYVKIYK